MALRGTPLFSAATRNGGQFDMKNQSPVRNRFACPPTGFDHLSDVTCNVDCQYLLKHRNKTVSRPRVIWVPLLLKRWNRCPLRKFTRILLRHLLHMFLHRVPHCASDFKSQRSLLISELRLRHPLGKKHILELIQLILRRVIRCLEGFCFPVMPPRRIVRYGCNP